jgi:hypothetical protein
LSKLDRFGSPIVISIHRKHENALTRNPEDPSTFIFMDQTRGEKLCISEVKNEDSFFNTLHLSDHSVVWCDYDNIKKIGSIHVQPLNDVNIHSVFEVELFLEPIDMCMKPGNLSALFITKEYRIYNIEFKDQITERNDYTNSNRSN